MFSISTSWTQSRFSSLVGGGVLRSLTGYFYFILFYFVLYEPEFLFLFSFSLLYFFFIIIIISFSIPKLNELYFWDSITKAGMDRDDMGGFFCLGYVGEREPRSISPPLPLPSSPRLCFPRTQIYERLDVEKKFLAGRFPHKGTILAVSVTSVSHESRWLTVQIEPTIERSIRTACWS